MPKPDKNPTASSDQEPQAGQLHDNYAEDASRDHQALNTRAVLRKQQQVQVYLQWTEENQKDFDAKKPLPYPKVEGVNINGVQYWIERGKMVKVPLSVAIILANAGKIPWDMVPDTVDGAPDGEPVREKLQAAEEKRRAEEERRRRYASIGEGLVK